MAHFKAWTSFTIWKMLSERNIFSLNHSSRPLCTVWLHSSVLARRGGGGGGGGATAATADLVKQSRPPGQ